MLKEQRREKILAELRRKDSITIEEIISLTNGSRSTARRDIEELEQENLLRRVRGGAMPIAPVRTPVASNEAEPPFHVRQDMFLSEKQRIAKAAHDLVTSNETLLLDGGTTVMEFAKTLNDISPLYVATNDLKSAVILADYQNVDLTVLGGNLRKSHYSLNGYFTEQMIGQMHADKAFIGLDAVDFNLGYMKFSAAEIQTNKLMLNASHQVIVLCDHSKFERVAFVNICKLEEIDLLITGHEISPAYLQQLHERGVNVMTV